MYKLLMSMYMNINISLFMFMCYWVYACTDVTEYVSVYIFY